MSSKSDWPRQHWSSKTSETDVKRDKELVQIYKDGKLAKVALAEKVVTACPKQPEVLDAIQAQLLYLKQFTLVNGDLQKHCFELRRELLKKEKYIKALLVQRDALKKAHKNRLQQLRECEKKLAHDSKPKSDVQKPIEPDSREHTNSYALSFLDKSKRKVLRLVKAASHKEALIKAEDLRKENLELIGCNYVDDPDVIRRLERTSRSRRFQSFEEVPQTNSNKALSDASVGITDATPSGDYKEGRILTTPGWPAKSCVQDAIPTTDVVKASLEFPKPSGVVAHPVEKDTLGGQIS